MLGKEGATLLQLLLLLHLHCDEAVEHRLGVLVTSHLPIKKP